MANLDDDILIKNNPFAIKPLPKFFNMLNNFDIIKYREIVIPRVALDSNNPQNLEQLFYSPLKKYELNENKIQKYHDIYIQLNKDDNENNSTEMKDKKQIFEKQNNDNKTSLLNQKKTINAENNSYFDNIKRSGILLNNNKKIIPIPPKKFISIINNDGGNQNGFNMKKSLSNNYENINNIILNNIHLFSNDICLQNNNNIFLPPYFTQINDSRIPNCKLDNFPCLNTSQFPVLQQDTKQCIPKILFSISPVNKEIKIKKKKVSKIRKRKYPDSNNRRIHTASDDDNILRKIQVHFLTFIINYSNDVVHTLIKEKNIPQFKNLDYKIKKTVNHKFVEELKSKSIGEILQLKVSPKMKKHDGSVNKIIYNTIYKKYPIIHEYMERNYLTLFKEYYNNKNKTFEVNGQSIQLSIRTKTFSDLTTKNYKYKEKLKYVAINYFLNCYKRIKKPNFKTHIIKK